MKTIESNFIKSSLIEAQLTLQNFIDDHKNVRAIDQCIEYCLTSINNDGIILICGNGGSMCDSNHFAEELTGFFRKCRPPIRAIAMNDAAHISCVSNDKGFDKIFSRYVEAFNSESNVLFVLSTSGNSPNVIEAVKEAKKNKMKVIGLLGKSGGKLREMVDIPIVIPAINSDRIQEIHIKIIHIIVEGIERALFPKHYS